MAVRSDPVFSRWMDAGEHELDGLAGDGYLQGILLSEVSQPRYTMATDRRLVMLEDQLRGKRPKLRSRNIFFEVPWTMVKGYWTGVMPFPPDLWRVGHEGEVIVFSLDPALADGQDLVVLLTTPEWVSTSERFGIPQVRDR
ncbi:MAG TPA: hypothetical protein VMZ51_03100 [Acidimicrobiales bacterium]|nr:hypothetical protein [Acidimicrobiales bacterium]